MNQVPSSAFYSRFVAHGCIFVMAASAVEVYMFVFGLGCVPEA